MKTNRPLGSCNDVWRQNIICPEDTTQYKNVLQCPDAVSSAKQIPIDPSCSMSCSFRPSGISVTNLKLQEQPFPRWLPLYLRNFCAFQWGKSGSIRLLLCMKIGSIRLLLCMKGGPIRLLLCMKSGSIRILLCMKFNYHRTLFCCQKIRTAAEVCCIYMHEQRVVSPVLARVRTEHDSTWQWAARGGRAELEMKSWRGETKVEHNTRVEAMRLKSTLERFKSTKRKDKGRKVMIECTENVEVHKVICLWVI